MGSVSVQVILILSPTTAVVGVVERLNVIGARVTLEVVMAPAVTARFVAVAALMTVTFVVSRTSIPTMRTA